MITQEKITTVLREHKQTLAVEYGIQRIGLFGS
jgi:predicted nucleotidyltransferase